MISVGPVIVLEFYEHLNNCATGYSSDHWLFLS